MGDIIRASKAELTKSGKSLDITKFSELARKAIEKSKQAKLIFGLDLTASREDTLIQARAATASMFEVVKEIGSLAVQLVYYRGNECKASKWQQDAGVFAKTMQSLTCYAGGTQINRIFKHAINETGTDKVSAVIFVGDHFEENEQEALGLAHRLKIAKTPVFIFHECADRDIDALEARPIFEKLAEASGGVYCPFNRNSSHMLRELLRSIAAYSIAGAEGIKQLEEPGTPEGKKLIAQLLKLPPPQ